MAVKGSKFPIRPCRWCGVEVTHAMDGWHPRNHFCPHGNKCFDGHYFGLPGWGGPITPFESGNSFGRDGFSSGPVIRHGCDRCLAAHIIRQALEPITTSIAKLIE